jgi:hypothetical protein
MEDACAGVGTATIDRQKLAPQTNEIQTIYQ